MPEFKKGGKPYRIDPVYAAECTIADYVGCDPEIIRVRDEGTLEPEDLSKNVPELRLFKLLNWSEVLDHAENSERVAEYYRLEGYYTKRCDHDIPGYADI